jgi:hypothetical protein
MRPARGKKTPTSDNGYSVAGSRHTPADMELLDLIARYSAASSDVIDERYTATAVIPERINRDRDTQTLLLELLDAGPDAGPRGGPPRTDELHELCARHPSTDPPSSQWYPKSDGVT